MLKGTYDRNIKRFDDSLISYLNTETCINDRMNCNTERIERIL